MTYSVSAWWTTPREDYPLYYLNERSETGQELLVQALIITSLEFSADETVGTFVHHFLLSEVHYFGLTKLA